MPIVKKLPYAPSTFFQMTKKSINDAELTWAAKGLLAYFMSKPPDWRVIKADLINRSVDGRKIVDRVLHELIDAGYVKMLTQERDPRTNFFLSVAYTVYDDYEEVESTPLYPAGDTRTGYSGVGYSGIRVSPKGTTTKNDSTNNDNNNNYPSKNKKQERGASSPEVKRKEQSLIPSGRLGTELLRCAGVAAFKTIDDMQVWENAIAREWVTIDDVRYWSSARIGYCIVDALLNQQRQNERDRWTD